MPAATAPAIAGVDGMKLRLANCLSPLTGASGRQRLAIVNYHRVLPEADPMHPNSPTRDTFRWHMAVLARHMNVLSLERALTLQARGQLPDRALCITFDDGYADNAEIAYPILREFGLSATIFVATAFTAGGMMWNDAIIEFFRIAPLGSSHRINGELYSIGETADSRRSTAAMVIRDIKHLPQHQRQDVVARLLASAPAEHPSLMMNAEQLRSLDPSVVTLGAHTVNHPILQSIDAQQAAFEIAESRRVIEDVCGYPVRLFAYPNGVPGRDFSPAHVELLRQFEFSAAVTTERGVASPGCDRYLLPRFTPWDKTPLRFLLRLLENYRRVK